MIHLGNIGTFVLLIGAIHLARRSTGIGHFKCCCLCYAIKIKACVQMIVSTQPFCPVGNGVSSSINNWQIIYQCCFHMIMHVLGRTAGTKMQHLVSSLFRVVDNCSVLVSSKKTPELCSVGEASIFQ